MIKVHGNTTPPHHSVVLGSNWESDSKVTKTSSALQINKIKMKHPQLSTSSTQTTHINDIYPAPFFTPLSHNNTYTETHVS